MSAEGYDEDGGGGGALLPPAWFSVLLLLLSSSVALYAQVVVTDLRFLPSLNVLCHALSIPPDVAAATIMSAGAASPNLNAVLISMFVTHSSLGAGTIVGSEMFQGLFCVAGAVWNARGGRVALDPMTAGREVGFYGLSLGLLVWMTIGKAGKNVQDEGNGEERDEIIITTWDSVILLLLYVVYVIVCAFFDKIVAFLRGGLRKRKGSVDATDITCFDPSSEYREMGDLSHSSPGGGGPETTLVHSATEEDVPFLRLLRHEPKQNFRRGNSGGASEEDIGGGIDCGYGNEGGDSFDDGNRPTEKGALEKAAADQVLVDANGERVVIGSFDPLHDTSMDTTSMDVSSSSLRLDKREGSDAGRPSGGQNKDSGNAQHKQPTKRRRIRKALSFLVCSGPTSPPTSPRGRSAGTGGAGEKPSQLHDLEDMELSPDGSSSLSCFLWQRSIFYDRARIGRNAWQLRWFTFRHDGTVESVPDRPPPPNSPRATSDAELGGMAAEEEEDVPGRLVYPPFGRVERDSAHLVLSLHSAVDDELAYVLMAPSEAVLGEVLRRVNANLPPPCAPPSTTAPASQRTGEHTAGGGGANVVAPAGDYQGVAEAGLKGKSPFSFEAEVIEAERESSPSLVDRPPPGSPFHERALHILLFPVKYLIYSTVPDVRRAAVRKAELRKSHPTEPTVSAALSIAACVVWLILNSYVMVASLERVGAIVGIPDAVLGITVSAIGTSVSVYVASVAAARQGLGNAAISNAFASNTFNILVGLGLPWALYCLAVSDDGTYRGLSDDSDGDGEDDGIETSIFILALSLGVTVIMMLVGRFVLRRWHAWALGGMYVLYLVYAVGRVCV